MRKINNAITYIKTVKIGDMGMNGKSGKVFITALLAVMILAFHSSLVVSVNSVSQGSIQSSVPMIKPKYTPAVAQEENLTERIEALNATLQDFNSTISALAEEMKDLKLKIADLKSAFADLTQWLYILSAAVPLIVVAAYHVATIKKKAK